MFTRPAFACLLLLSLAACSKETKTPPPAAATSGDATTSAASTDSGLAPGGADSKPGAPASTDSALAAPGGTDSNLNMPASTDSTLAGGSTDSNLGAAASTDSALAGPGSTDSSLAAGSTDSALAGPKTSDDVLRKWADICKNAKVIYEETKLSARIEGPRPANPTDVLAKAAFKRSDVITAEIAGRQNLIIHWAGGEGTIYNRDANQYFRTQQPLAAFSRVFQQLFSLSIILADEPYALMTRQVTKIEDLKTCQFEGKEVYEVGLNVERSVKVTFFFDKETFYLIGATAHIPVADGKGAIDVLEIVGRVLVDELPKDADGKEIDVLAFTLPEGATEATMARPPQAGPPSPPSTDSDAKP
jgi:hypothetical protein